mmetsp:Transcript_29531/g.41034  ORF Transcript_29531/g.41034 Transcript_29531/m.41034 type:complete len:502 (+) Transcript_29531:64-1569(+)
MQNSKPSDTKVTKPPSISSSTAKLFGVQADPKEIVSTEEIYLNRLRVLIESYYDPIKNSLGTKKEILNEDELRRVFNIIPLLFSFHLKLHQDLKTAGTAENSKMAIASVLNKHAPYLRMYKDYVNNLKTATNFVTTAKQKRFREFLQITQRNRGTKGMDLITLLTLPVHRLPQYKDLMENLLESTEEGDEEFKLVKQATDLCTEVTQQVNKAFAEYDEAMAKFVENNPKFRKGSGVDKKTLLNNNAPTVKPPIRRKPSVFKSHKSVERQFSRSEGDIKSNADIFVEQFAATWTSAKTVVYKDLPRLVKRISVTSTGGGNEERKFEVEAKGSSAAAAATTSSTSSSSSLSSSSSSPPSTSSGGGVWDSVCKLIMFVAKELETQEKLEELKKALKDHNVQDNAEIFPSLKDVFEKCLGLDSKTFAIFKTTHQSMLVPAMVKLAESVFKPLGQNFKDVNRPEGWKIQIHIGEAIYIVHKRIEQSLHSPDDPKVMVLGSSTIRCM